MKQLNGLKVTMLTTGHPPNDARIFYKESRTLAKAGAEVRLVYPDNGVGQLPQNENRIAFSGVSIEKGLKNRLRKGRLFFDKLMAEKTEVIHCHEPDALYWAIKAKKEQPGIRIIYDSHEMWGAVFAERLPAWSWGLSHRFYDLCEKQLLHKCDGAIGAANAITSYLQKNIKSGIVSTIYNVPDSSTFPDSAPAPVGEKIVLVHEGHLTFDRGLKTIAAAVKDLSADYPIVLKIVGDTFNESREWLDNYCAANNLEKVITKTGWLPYDQVGPALAEGHIGVNGHIYNPNNAICAPNKCFNYLYYGLAQVGANLPQSHFKILADEGCALLYKIGDSKALAGCLEKYLKDPNLLDAHRRKALELSKTKYRWERMAPILLSLYERVLAADSKR